MNLADINTIKKFMGEGFAFKKSMGQNFLINPEVCPQMAAAAADKDTAVLEIGPGIGVLTYELSKVAGKVVAIELDKSLQKILPVTLKDCDNVEIIYGDAMKMDLKALIAEKFEGYKKVAVCANLPYYITSPIITMLLESKLPIDNVTVMVQKEAAERLCAEVGSRESGAVTVAVRYFSEPEILFEVPRDSFMPAPNVDSAVIRLKILEKPPVEVNDEKKFFKFVKAAFGQRRKTLSNSLSSLGGYSKDDVNAALEKLNLRTDIRAEALDMNSLADIFNTLQS